ncbi:MAG: glycosyltransferase 87 family protein [Candidatus Omnitrophica bacterium]|jgi:hypothetical protein|nr:glycosyltransferase 87 family protein [Candidatus Omnitrophota bacterium]
MNKKEKISLLSLIVLLGFSIAVFYHYFFGTYLGNGYPVNTFLFRPRDCFSDFTSMFFSMADYNPYLGMPPTSTQTMLPFLFAIEYIFIILKPFFSFLIFLFSFLAIFAYIVHKNIKMGEKASDFMNMFVICFLSYPFLLSVDRLNIEVLCLFALYFSISSYANNKFWFSAVLLGLAISMKPFPAVFILLFLSDKKYRQVLLILGMVFVLNFVALASFKGAIGANWERFVFNLGLYKQAYVIGNEGLYFGHSLFGFLKTILVIAQKRFQLPYFVSPYMAFSLVCAGFIALYVLIVEKTFWKKILLLVCCMELFPYVSGDYRLMYFYIPLLFFINAPGNKLFDRAFIILFALLLIPKNYWRYALEPELSLSVLVNPIIIVSLLILSIVSSVKKQKEAAEA